MVARNICDEALANLANFLHTNKSEFTVYGTRNYTYFFNFIKSVFFQLTIEAQKENKGFYAKVVKKG